MIEKNEIRLSPRLTAIAQMVRTGARLCDVGTDHAYLPAYLLQQERIEAARCSDIAPAPVQRAKRTAALAGVREKTEILCAPGLDGAQEFAPTDVVIAGMGGEMIASILAKAPLVKDPAVLLLLQPMTRPEALRRYLAENGFAIRRERLVRDQDRFYRILACAYTGIPYPIDAVQAHFGAGGVLADEDRENERIWMQRMRRQLETRAFGKRKGGVIPTEEEELLTYLREKAGTEGDDK